jgi:hypothetical protein
VIQVWKDAGSSHLKHIQFACRSVGKHGSYKQKTNEETFFHWDLDIPTFPHSKTRKSLSNDARGCAAQHAEIWAESAEKRGRYGRKTESL